MPERQPLPSKKNHIYREQSGEQMVVVKQFTDPQRFQMEKEIGSLLQDTCLAITRRLSVNEPQQQIVYAYIDAQPLVDLIETAQPEQARNMIAQVCAWMIMFYRIMRDKTGQPYILGDVHLRNFLYQARTGQVYGVDFEECRLGRIETDVARLFTFILHYEPAFSKRKIELAEDLQKLFFNTLALDKNFYLREINRETEELLQRRRQHR